MNQHQWFTSSNGRIEFQLELADARQGSHPGPCDLDIAELRQKPYIKEILTKLSHADVVEELRGYGAWDDEQLADHEENLNRILWLACGDIAENDHTN